MLRCISTRHVIENSKKNAKNFKNFENTNKASFQAKIGWKRARKRENKKKNFLIGNYPSRNRKFQKNSKKNSKNQKTIS